MKTINRYILHVASIACLVAGVVDRVTAQDYGTRLGTQRGGKVSFAPYGPGVLFGALDPAVKKWYVPQELHNEYKWRQWEYTNYARDHYQRYVNTSLEGDYFYDLFGNFVTRGWLIFDNSQTQPRQFGSSLTKAKRFDGWFSGVAIASDQKGQYHYALTVSNQLRTTLTPMTFAKPLWDGTQFDFAMDKYEGTLVYSRVSSPGGVHTLDQELVRTNLTTLSGGRVKAQIGDFTSVGLQFVNTHQSNTLVSGFKGNPVAGALTIDQNSTISSIQIVLRDDSPEDGEGGAAFFRDALDIFITYTNGKTDKGRDIRFEPVIQGGFVQEGFLSADGTEEIKILFDFDSPAFVNRSSGAKEEIKKVEFSMTIGNDYQVWMSSDRQTNASGQPVLLLVARAEGNVQDNTNLRVLEFEYGLPTATQIVGGTVEINNVRGFNFYGEYDLSLTYRQYPNITRKSHSTSSGISGRRTAPAWMMNLSKVAHPWFFFGEAYSMDPLYSTRTFVTRPDGSIDYEDTRQHVVELVDDNDDQDRFPDAIRADWRQGDRRVFPGWDENNDFVPDFNQNDNFRRTNDIPDYEEAFLRHNVDRPEQLFGVDMNNNQWVDRFENDEEPDYPYANDHRGFNAYFGYHLTPDVRVTLGHLREDLISSGQKNHTSYALFTLDQRTPTLGRLRLMEMVKRAEDDIPDDLLQWFPDVTVKDGLPRRVEDPLLARDTWINSFWVGHDYDRGGLDIADYLKYDFYHQRKDRETREALGLARANDFFFGLINKVSYRYPIGNFTLEPRWKSEWRWQSRGLLSTDKERVLTEILGLLLGFPVLKRTTVQSGIEYTFANDFREDAKDFRGLAVAVQLANASHYLGYVLTTQIGMKVDRRDFKEQEADTTTEGFITMYAGLGN